MDAQFKKLLRRKLLLWIACVIVAVVFVMPIPYLIVGIDPLREGVSAAPDPPAVVDRSSGRVVRTLNDKERDRFEAWGRFLQIPTFAIIGGLALGISIRIVREYRESRRRVRAPGEI